MLQLAGMKSSKEQGPGGEEGAGRAEALSSEFRREGLLQLAWGMIPHINPLGKKSCALKSCLPILPLENEDNNT